MTQNIRDDFMLRDDWRLLNNGSFGACPRPVFESYLQWLKEFEKHPGGYMAAQLERLTEARTRVAEYLHTDQSQLAFVTNATMGVNVVTHSMRSYLQPGDEVLTTNHEYGACNHAWQFNCEKAGALYIEHPIDLPIYSDEDFVERFWSGVTDKTKVIYLSHTTSPTALTFPLTELCRRAREAGIFSVIDGAHVPGQRDLFLDEIGCDFYVGNFHKWAMGAKGTAFLYVRSDKQHLIEPLIVGHGWHPGERSEQPLIDYVEQFGTRELGNFLSVPAALDYMEEHDWPAVRTRCHQMALAAKHKLEEHFDTESVCPETFEWFSQLVPIRLPDSTDMRKLGQIMREEYQIEMPMIDWQGRDQRVKIARISVQGYTSQEEVDAFVDVIMERLPECQVVG